MPKPLNLVRWFLQISSIIFLLQQVVTSSYSSSSCDDGTSNNSNVIFSFPTFNTSNCEPRGGLLCMGTVTPGEGFLNLTKAASSNSSSTSDYMSAARVLYHNPVQVWPASFCTSFSLRIFPGYDQLKVSGDGMTLVMATNNKSSPTRSIGSYLGLQDSSLEGDDDLQQLAVEFDTFKNEWDPDGNHIGVDTVSAMKSLVAKTLNSSHVDLKSGKQIKVKIEYNGWTKELQIYVGYEGKPLTSSLNYSIQISKEVPKNVYIGFTASTGLLTETHQLLDWVFTSTILPEGTVKDDRKKCFVTLATVLSVLGGFLLLGVIAIPFLFLLMKGKNN